VQAKLAFTGNAPLVGVISRLKVAVCPAETDVLGGVAVIVKSKPPLAVALNVTGTKCVVVAASVPTARILKL
jgi:hypothetical protein